MNVLAIQGDIDLGASEEAFAALSFLASHSLDVMRLPVKCSFSLFVAGAKYQVLIT